MELRGRCTRAWVRRCVRSGLGAVVCGVALGTMPVGTAAGQQEFPQTLYWGSGLIDIPVAWAMPLSGDFALGYSGKRFRTDPVTTRLNYDDRMNSQFTFSTAFSISAR